MSDVYSKIQAQELRKIKVSEPSSAYVAKPTPREVIFALDIPYPLFIRAGMNSYKIFLDRKLNIYQK